MSESTSVLPGRFLWLAIVGASLAWPQVRGVVSDSSGAPIPNARLTLTNPDTRTTRTTESQASGAFFLSNVPPATYTLRAEAPGFAPATTAVFPVPIGQTVEQRLTLAPAGVIEKLEVSDQPEAIDTTASNASVVLGGDRIEEAPARSRNYLNFVLAAPGVAPSAGAPSQRTMTGVRSPLADSGFTFGGLRPRNNSILIDGMDNRDETTGGNRVAVGLEMVQEFQVAGASTGAELGGAAGGLLNMVTRSGVNLFHGDLTFFAQNEITNARKPEAIVDRNPRFRRYQPGFSLLGPLRRDHTFFAFAVEHERESAEEWSDVPAAAELVIRRVLPTSGVRRGLFDTSTRGSELSAKLSHQISNSGTVAARYAFSRGRVRGEVQGPDNFADASAQGNSLTSDHSLVANWLHVASPTAANDLRIQIASRSLSLTPNRAGGPMIEIPGVATFGEYFRMNADRRERHYQAVETWNASLGAHRFSLGADTHLVTFDGQLRNRFAGLFVFPTLDDFVAARPDIYIQAFGDPRTDFRTLPVGLWLQDRWQARPGLHLEAGLRFDRQRMPYGLPSSSNNFAPRLGLAWRPSSQRPLVLRAGAGFFFDRYPLAYLNDALQKNGRQAFEVFATGPDAVRAYSLSPGLLPGLFPRSRYQASTAFPSTYARKLNAGFEHGFGTSTSLSVEASHVSGYHLPRIRRAGEYLLEQSARSDSFFTSVTLNRRLSKELAYLVTYGLGRTRDNASDFDEHPLDPANTRLDWALSRQHQAQRLAASALFELPFLENVTFAPIFTTGSGRPINALATTDLYRTGAYPISARPAGVARNPYQSPRTMSLDLRVMKTFKVMHERALLQIGVESFNLTNHSNTERVSPYFASTVGRLNTYGATLESLPARQVQFLIQFEY